MPPRKVSTNAFGVGDLRDEDETPDPWANLRTSGEAEVEAQAKDAEEGEETEALLAVDDRPVYRLLREKEEWVDRGLERAFADGYTEIIGGVGYHSPFFYIITKRAV